VQDRYLATTSVQRMAAHLRLVARMESAASRHRAVPPSRPRLSDLVVVTQDVPGLFSLIAGTLAAHGVNIISAQIATRADGVAIDTFQVNDPTGEAVTSAAQWAAPSTRWRRPHARAVGGDAAGTAARRRADHAGRRGEAEDRGGQPAVR